VSFREERAEDGAWTFRARATRPTQAQAYFTLAGVVAVVVGLTGQTAGFLAGAIALGVAYAMRPRTTVLTIAPRGVTYDGRPLAPSPHEIQGVDVAPMRKNDPTSPPLLFLQTTTGTRTVIDVGSLDPAWLAQAAARVQAAVDDVKNRGGYRGG
jgi:hypothetical protein